MKPCYYLDTQENCEHFIKATHFKRCMHLKFGEYCGNGTIFKVKSENNKEKDEKK
jgi:hypothetical protein